jgi:hypothetical protein
MLVLLAAAFSVLALSEPAEAQTTNTVDACAYNRAALLALSYDRFDQDLNGGWRYVSNGEGCGLVAADLIAAYRDVNAPKLTPYNVKLLNWHEAQLRASAGQVAESISLFERTFDPHPGQTAWNDYVRATLAFMRGDRPALLAARDSLARTPKPEGFEEMRRQFREKFGSEFRWPANLDVVDGLIACFGKPYREAYSGEACRPRRDPPVQLSPRTTP